MNYWLTKQEPATYSWDDLVREKKTAWTGVRNFQARNNLKGMKKGDLICFYHSGDDKQVVGIATVVKEAYPDSTADEGDWVCVDVAPVKPFEKPVTLAQIKATKAL
jgi:predicted RNA-binding protein with PUA-like domain